jgi:hypothetical protein
MAPGPRSLGSRPTGSHPGELPFSAEIAWTISAYVWVVRCINFIGFVEERNQGN